MISNARGARPALDGLAVAVVDARKSEPAGVDDLSGNAERVLAIGPDPRRRGRRAEGGRGESAWPRRTRSEEIAVRAGREVRGDVAGEFVEDAGRKEGREREVAGLQRSADADAGAADLAGDVVDLQGAGNIGSLSAARLADRRKGIEAGPGIGEAGRGLDEPVVGEREIVTRVDRQRRAATRDRLREEAGTGIAQCDIVEVLFQQRIGEEPAVGRDPIGADKRNLDVAGESIVEGSRIGFQIAGRGAEVQVPAVPVQPCGIGADLEAGIVFTDFVVAVVAAFPRATRLSAGL